MSQDWYVSQYNIITRNCFHPRDNQTVLVSFSKLLYFTFPTPATAC